MLDRLFDMMYMNMTCVRQSECAYDMSYVYMMVHTYVRQTIRMYDRYDGKSERQQQQGRRRRRRASLPLHSHQLSLSTATEAKAKTINSR